MQRQTMLQKNDKFLFFQVRQLATQFKCNIVIVTAIKCWKLSTTIKANEVIVYQSFYRWCAQCGNYCGCSTHRMNRRETRERSTNRFQLFRSKMFVIFSTNCRVSSNYRCGHLEFPQKCRMAKHTNRSARNRLVSIQPKKNRFENPKFLDIFTYRFSKADRTRSDTQLWGVERRIVDKLAKSLVIAQLWMNCV